MGHRLRTADPDGSVHTREPTGPSHTEQIWLIDSQGSCSVNACACATRSGRGDVESSFLRVCPHINPQCECSLPLPQIKVADQACQWEGRGGDNPTGARHFGGTWSSQLPPLLLRPWQWWSNQAPLNYQHQGPGGAKGSLPLALPCLGLRSRATLPSCPRPMVAVSMAGDDLTIGGQVLVW